MIRIKVLLPFLITSLLFILVAGSAYADSDPALHGMCSQSLPTLLMSWNRGEEFDACKAYYYEGRTAINLGSKKCEQGGFAINQFILSCGTYRLCVEKTLPDGSKNTRCSGQVTVPNCAAGGTLQACSPPTPPRGYGPPPVSSNIPQAVSRVFGLIQPPEFIDQIGFGGEGINRILDVFVLLIFSVGTIIFLFMILVSAVQWISSGGDKEAIAGARKRVTNAVIGLILLAVAFMLLRIIGTVLNLKLFF